MLHVCGILAYLALGREAPHIRTVRSYPIDGGVGPDGYPHKVTAPDVRCESQF